MKRFAGRVQRLSPLETDTEADVAIVGGGLTGLWTARRLRRVDPALSIVILEADFCGSGASGANGGHVHSSYTQFGYLEKVAGREEALRFCAASVEAIAEMAALAGEGIDVDLRTNGFAGIATTAAHSDSWRDVPDSLRGVDSRLKILDATEAADFSGLETAYAGLQDETGGTIDPFALCVGMRDGLVADGVRIFERSPVTSLRSNRGVELRTPGGVVRAKKALLATNAWSVAIPELRRRVYVVKSHVVALPADTPVAGRALSDAQMRVRYWHRTADGTLVIGRGTGAPVFGARIGRRSRGDRRAFRGIRSAARRMYGAVGEPRAEWSGYIDASASHVPLIGALRGAPDIHFCVGYTGTALAQIPVYARMLAARLAGVDDEWSTSRLANQPSAKPIVPEPFRWVGAHVVLRAVRFRAHRERAGKSAGPLVDWVIGLMPRYRAE